MVLHKATVKYLDMRRIKLRGLFTRSFSCSPGFASSFTRFFVCSFSPVSVRRIVESLTRSFGYPFAHPVIRSLVLPLSCSFAFVTGQILRDSAGFSKCFIWLVSVFGAHSSRNDQERLLNAYRTALFMLKARLNWFFLKIAIIVMRKLGVLSSLCSCKIL